jgi:hypothetical protein
MQLKATAKLPHIQLMTSEENLKKKMHQPWQPEKQCPQRRFVEREEVADQEGGDGRHGKKRDEKYVGDWRADISAYFPFGDGEDGVHEVYRAVTPWRRSVF